MLLLAEFFLSLFGFRPEQSLFIDDNLRNIIAADEMGIQTIHFQKPNEFKSILKEKGVEF